MTLLCVDRLLGIGYPKISRPLAKWGMYVHRLGRCSVINMLAKAYIYMQASYP